MSKYFVDCETDIGEIIKICGDDFHHIKNVLRKRPGEQVDVGNGKGEEYKVTLKRFYADCIEASVDQIISSNTESQLNITLFQGIPKFDKMEFIIQKCVELGVKKIVPVKCTRSISKIDDTNAQKKIERWQKIAFEAAKQSNRGIVPVVTMPIDFKAVILQEKDQLFGIIPYENEENRNLKKILIEVADKTNNIGIFVGPEGGFEEAEILFAKDNGIIPVSLGPRILRTETAGLALISMVMYQCGDMGE